MPQLIVEAIAPVGSWRPPEAMTFHRTYPLPPYTSLVGMLGAAMGKSLLEAFSFLEEHDVRLGVGGWSSGMMKDLWKHQKLGSKETINAILLREHCIDLRLAFVIATNKHAALDEIRSGFEVPAYPLTAGQSDSLLRVVSTNLVDAPIVDTNTVHSALLFGELAPDYRTALNLSEVPLTHTIQAPIVERIPTTFTFDATGKRTLAGRALVTYVADPVTVPDEHRVSGYVIEPRSTFLKQRPFGCKELSWVIPVHRF